MTKVSIQCKYPNCEKTVDAHKDMKYCPYCGASFELYKININSLINIEESRIGYIRKTNLWLTLISTFLLITWILSMLLYISKLPIYKRLEFSFLAMILSLVSFMGWMAFILLFNSIYIKKKAKSKFPDLDPNKAS